MLYQSFKKRLFIMGVSLVLLCTVLLGAFGYNYFLSREAEIQHDELSTLAMAIYQHSNYVINYALKPEGDQLDPTDCELGVILKEIIPATYEQSIHYNQVTKLHEEFHQVMGTGSLEEVTVFSQRLSAALAEYNVYLANEIGQLESLRTKVIVAVALPGLFLIVVLLIWLYVRMYKLIQNKIVAPLKNTLNILSQTGLYTITEEDEPEAVFEAVKKASQIIDMDNSRRKLYPFWNSVFTEEELLNGSLELFGENQLVASAAFFRYDSFTDLLTLGASYAFPTTGEQRILYGVGPIGEAAKRQKPVLIKNPDLELSLGFGTVRPALLGCYPVGIQKLYGVLALAYQAEPSPEQLTVAEFFGAQLGIVMDRVRQLDDLKKMTWELGNRTRSLNKELRYKNSILNSSADGIAIIGVDGVINLFSKGAEEITGYSADEAVGNLCCDVLRHRDRSFKGMCHSELCAICSIAAAKTPVSGKELYVEHKHGHNVPILLSATPLFDEQGEVTEILQVFKDVTELRNTLTQLEQANRSKTEFLATMSHELRTPLNAVLGFAELLETESFGPLNDRQKRYTGNILTAGRHLLSLINDILDITRVESGKADWEYAPLDVTQLFGSAVSLLREKAVQNQIKLSLEIEPGFQEFAGDERKLKQILYNLINNAIKFTPAEGQIGVQVASEDEGMLITVWDTGVGIPPDKRGVVFEPFYQVDNYLTRSQQGSGLGLALVKKMVDLAGGRVWLAEEEGKSTVVNIFLPSPEKRLSNDELSIVAGDKKPFSQNFFHGELTMADQGLAILVEDDESSAELLEDYLKEMDYRVLITPSGEEAIAKIKAEKPALIVLDILLPGMNGWEMLAEIKSDPTTASIPVIVVSILEEKEKGLALGAVDYLTKPVDRARLIACVQKIAANSREERFQALVIDDDLKALELFNDYLTSMGVDAFLAPDPQEGLKIAREILPDIIFLDLIMPGMDGFTFLEQKEKDQKLKDISVVVVTSKSLTVGEKNFLEERVEHVARKSEFGQKDFQAIVEKIAGKEVAKNAINRPSSRG